LGRRAELAVADFLFARGFSVLSRNRRVGALEIDIVARKGRLVAIVEVRTRGPGALTSAFESVNLEKRQRLRRAAQRLWRVELARIKDVDRVRIDVAAVTFRGANTSVEYIEGAID
jgi:putative endonuclease